MEAVSGSVMNKLSSNSSQDEKYTAVNAALNGYFFRGRFAMQPVYLDLEEKTKSKLAGVLRVHSDELESLIGSCAANSLRFDKANPYTEQEEWLKEWNKTDRKTPPPFTALLCALSIAAERMGADENFSPNNYYERLFELFGVKETKSRQKLYQKAKHTRQFWHALNLWLTDNDFVFGRPTARALIPNWKYASYALSQALVRDADRKRFSGLFETYDILPDQPIAEAEMALFIHDWMTHTGAAGPTALLRKLWTANNIRDRVVSAAIDALETWKNPVFVPLEGPRNAQFRWLMKFTSVPRKRVRLLLAVIQGGQEESLRPSPTSAHAETGLSLEKGNDPDILFLGPTQSIDLNFLLLKSREFIGDESGTSYKYTERPIVPLVRSPNAPTYREVARVRLFEEHIILCYGNTWLKKVENHLSKCARPGYTVFGSSDMQGIPKDWYILRGVEIVKSDENTTNDVHALNPISSDATVTCVNGLELGHNTWHADARPVIKAAAEKPNCTLEIVREQFDEAEKTLLSSKITDDFVEIALDSLEIFPRTNLRAEIKKAKNTIDETSFSLRSADIPRPLDKKRIFHPIAENGRFLFDTDSDISNGLEGCLIHGDLKESDTEIKSNFVNNQSEIPEGICETSLETDWQHSIDAMQRAKESCVIRGYHCWRFESYEKGDDRFEPKMGKCKDCHTKTLSRSREEAKGNWRRMNQQDLPVVRTVQEEADETNQTRPDFSNDELISSDVVYDGLCYLGQGTWKEFQRIVSRSSQEFWFSHSFANDLFALGYLEIHIAFDFPASNWSVPPPVLVVVRNNEGYLTGFRSKTLLERINEVLIQKGAHHEPISASEQVTVHRWTGLAELDIETLLKDIVDPYGRSVTAIQDVDRFIASKLPALDKFWEHGKQIHVEKPDNLAKFDVHQARWTHVDALQDPGAYRIGLHGTRYVYRNADGITRQVGYQVAKILAARAKNTQLHKYNPETGQFIATLGANPPNLFARALVTSSGMLPKTEEGRLIYENVDPITATLTLNKMYGKDVNLE